MATLISLILYQSSKEYHLFALPAGVSQLYCIFCSALILPSPKRFTFPMNANLRWPILCYMSPF